MKWNDIFLAAFNNLMRRKLRSMLTMLGVVIGTAAIVVTISLGFGAEKTQMAALESYSNLRLISVYPSWGSSSSDSGGSQNRITKINDSVLTRIRHVAGVDAVTPIVNFYLSASFIIKTGKLENNAWLTAVSPRDFAKIKQLKEGTYFSNNTDRMEFLMSEIPLLEFRDPKNDDDEWVNWWDLLMNDEPLPLPKVNWLRANYKLLLRWEDYTNVNTDSESDPVEKEQEFKAKMMGILKTDKQEMNDQFNYGPIVSLNWLKRFAKENKPLMKELGLATDALSTYQTVIVLAKDVDSVTQISKDLVEMGLQCSSMLTSIEQMRGQIRTMQAFLGFIGMISMFVAALSIANTMMMSIYERTREIGVMKVLGCKLGNIRMMFLSEAAFIGFFGGLFGLALSYALSWALNNVPALQNAISAVMNGNSYYGTTEDATTSIIPAFLAMGTWLGVVLVSVVSGIQPAQRAMKLSSLAAIRSAD